MMIWPDSAGGMKLTEPIHAGGGSFRPNTPFMRASVRPHSSLVGVFESQMLRYTIILICAFFIFKASALSAGERQALQDLCAARNTHGLSSYFPLPLALALSLAPRSVTFYTNCIYLLRIIMFYGSIGVSRRQILQLPATPVFTLIPSSSLPLKFL